MNRRSRNYKWLMGFDTKLVHCPDGKARRMDFRDFLWWQDRWSRGDAEALDRYDNTGITGLPPYPRPEPEAPQSPRVDVTGITGSAVAKGIAARLKARGYV